MYAECRHVLPAGLKCTAPRVGDSNFCYRHRNLHERMCAPAPRPGTPFRLPSLEDSHGCLNAIQEVAWAMGDKRISSSQATVEFLGKDQGTLLVFTEQAAFFEGADGPKMRQDGWTLLLEALGKELSRT